ncbi:hypothetical protein CY652_23335 [Burkholderia sp. WAC0059]|uniref:type 4 pilus major pilin n=1 Tax=Burkholderia sp. WAC0059 TaxID=2066022 RepID=UPI000C7EB76B|nr:type 4 pilus major pilin [Burkholderia sp. WAC0059]PLY99998.1 hypothetical protein CY652_23335 [Burkholderia sp. WAC0059]
MNAARRLPVPRQRSRQRGLTLLEAIAVLGIAAIVLVGAISLFHNATTAASASRLVDEVTGIENNVRSLSTSANDGVAQILYASSQSSQAQTGALMTQLAEANVFPQTLEVSTVGNTTNVTDEWGGSVLVSPSQTVSNQLAVSFLIVPPDVCTRALIAPGDWLAVSVNGDGAVSTFTSTPSLAQAQTACDTSTGFNIVTWSFAL